MIDLGASIDRLVGAIGGAGGHPQAGRPGQTGQPAGSGPSPLAGLGGLGGGGAFGGMAGGAAMGGLAALLVGTKTGRKIGGSALKYGGIAAVGALAYHALRRASTPGAPQPTAQAEVAAPSQDEAQRLLPGCTQSAGQQDLARALITAMISAAHADGHIDETERQKIMQAIEGMEGLGSKDRIFLFDQLSNPADVSAVADLATTPELQAEIYLASRLMLDPDQATDRAYLDRLAIGMGLQSAVRQELERAALEAAPA